MTIHFAGIEPEFSGPDSQVYLQSLPYDGTSSWGKGAHMGFEAFLEAAENMELYDIETDSCPYENGIHVCTPMNELKDHESVTPEQAFEMVYEKTKSLLDQSLLDQSLLDQTLLEQTLPDKTQPHKTQPKPGAQKRLLTFFGGEHSISIGIIKAFSEKYRNLSVFHLDAHSDLRPEYGSTPYNHACAMHLPSKWCNVVQTGIRSMALEEKKYIKKENLFTARWINDRQSETKGLEWMDEVVSRLGSDVYISLDLDVFDPSIMASTGTPEPGGLDWYTVTGLLKRVFDSKNVLGFDIVELAPVKGCPAPDFMTAKLYYKMLSWYFDSKR